MPPGGFETTFSAPERPQTYALDRAATGVGGTISQMLISIKYRRLGKDVTILSEFMV
jgi:hypothetical protein